MQHSNYLQNRQTHLQSGQPDKHTADTQHSINVYTTPRIQADLKTVEQQRTREWSHRLSLAICISSPESYFRNLSKTEGQIEFLPIHFFWWVCLTTVLLCHYTIIFPTLLKHCWVEKEMSSLNESRGRDVFNSLFDSSIEFLVLHLVLCLTKSLYFSVCLLCSIFFLGLSVWIMFSVLYAFFLLFFFGLWFVGCCDSDQATTMRKDS